MFDVAFTRAIDLTPNARNCIIIALQAKFRHGDVAKLVLEDQPRTSTAPLTPFGPNSRGQQNVVSDGGEAAFTGRRQSHGGYGNQVFTVVDAELVAAAGSDGNKRGRREGTDGTVDNRAVLAVSIIYTKSNTVPYCNEVSVPLCCACARPPFFPLHYTPPKP